MSRTAISAALRQRVAETARFRCGYCLTSQRVVGPLLEISARGSGYVPTFTSRPDRAASSMAQITRMSAAYVREGAEEALGRL